MSSSHHSRSLYAQRMNKVLDHLDLHLDAPLDLAALAALAHFSPYHFHRLFTAWMGETLGDYLRRRRLELGALRLAARPAMPVLEVALAVGFGSGEAFSRAFKLRFGCSPTDWRRATPARWAEQCAAAQLPPPGEKRNLDQAGAASMQHHDDAYQAEPELAMEVKLVTLPPTRVAYMRYIGAYGPSISTFWKERFEPWARLHDLGRQPRYGISHDDPSITEPDKCRYDACIEVPADFQADRAVNLITLPGGRYATTQFVGTGPTIGAAWIALFREWLPASGYACDARPCFEYYPVDAHYDPQTGAFECTLCVPICPL